MGFMFCLSDLTRYSMLVDLCGEEAQAAWNSAIQDASIPSLSDDSVISIWKQFAGEWLDCTGYKAEFAQAFSEATGRNVTKDKDEDDAEEDDRE